MGRRRCEGGEIDDERVGAEVEGLAAERAFAAAEQLQQLLERTAAAPVMMVDESV